MGYNYKPCDREQGYLLPPSLRDWVPDGDLSWFILDVVGQMDTTAFYKGYRPDGLGASLYQPEMLLSLMLYAYCWGQRSSRKIEFFCERDVSYRVITANARIDHTTICRFRKRNKAAVERLFLEVLRLCHEAGLVKVGVVGLDGTKLAGNAALAANRTAEHLETEIKKMLEEADRVDAEEDARYGPDKRGDELPEELRHQGSRLQRLRECQQRLAAEAAAKRRAQEEKLAARAAKEKESGQPTRGRKPKTPEAVVNQEAKANVTDPESRIMKNSKGWVQGYNAQIVATEEQIIIAAELTQEENDQHQLRPMLAAARENLQAAGCPETMGVCVADAGYSDDDQRSEPPPAANEEKAAAPTTEKTEPTVAVIPAPEPELIIATKKDWKQRQALAEQEAPRGRIPKGLSKRELMERKLQTKRGKALYKKRAIIPEPIFGQIKSARGIAALLMRGVAACDSEWKLICATSNLLKLFRSGRVAWG